VAAVYYPSLDDAEVIEVEFLTLQGSVRVLKLLSAVRRVAEVGVDPIAMVQNAAGVRLGAESPLILMLARPGVADTAKGQVGNQRLDKVERQGSSSHMLSIRLGCR
jgi:hypothetical protein